nr:Plug domain-containing protein [Hymenobacter pini]
MLQYAKQQASSTPVWTTSGTVALGNVVIKGQSGPTTKPTDGVARTYNSPAAIYLPVGHLAATAGSQTVVQYLRGRVAGVLVNGESVNIRGAITLHNDKTGGPSLIPPLYMLDGNIISGAQFATVPLAEIETIDILKQNAANMFGTQAYGGVIILHSRNRSIDTPKQEQRLSGNTPVITTSLPSYYQAREFYMPRYTATSSTQPDPRHVTLFWAPTIRTQPDGTAQFTFYTSDAKGSFTVSAEGLAAAHIPLYGTTSLRVQEKN